MIKWIETWRCLCVILISRDQGRCNVAGKAGNCLEAPSMKQDPYRALITLIHSHGNMEPVTFFDVRNAAITRQAALAAVSLWLLILFTICSNQWLLNLMFKGPNLISTGSKVWNKSYETNP